MSVLYDQAPSEVHDMARDILERHHPELRLPDGNFVTLCILMAFQENKECTEPAVKLHNYPCAAIVSIIPYKQRVDKRADAEIIIDQKVWDELIEPSQRALLDHEITHLTFQIDENGALKTDDQGRPKLTMRNHDWQLGGFETIAKRYKQDALDVIEIRKFQEKYGAVTLAPEKEPEQPGMFAQ